MKAHNIISLQEIKPIEPIKGWEEFKSEGNAFLKTASNAHAGDVRSFTPEILYNIIAMAIEKLVMAALMKHGTMPYNHTMADLVEAMEETFPGVITEIRDGLLAFDKYQEICDVDAFRITPPQKDEIPSMLEIANRLQLVVTNELTTVM